MSYSEKKLGMLFIAFLISLSFFIYVSVGRYVATREIAKMYLYVNKYKVINYCGKIEEYTIDNSILSDRMHMLQWGIQDNQISQFMGQRVTVEKYIVTNHPLDQWSSKVLSIRLPDGTEAIINKNIMQSNGTTEMYLFVVNKKVIGGYSKPSLTGFHLMGEDEMYWTLNGERGINID